ncbi:MAG: MOSC domain-containing protein [Actinomycetota bacterium]
MSSAAASVTSVNVGTIREIVYQGRTRTTGIWKVPVAGRRAVLTGQVEGDSQADLEFHGGPSKAVYLYAAEDYAWWQETLGAELSPGTFGENLTVAGVDVAGLGIGARLRVGTVLLEAVQPRFPCWKLGLRMGDPKFPKRFLKAARAGAYCSVVEEGAVEAGDPVVLVSQPDHPVTIGLIAHLNSTDRQLAQLLMDAVPAGLSPEEWAAILPGVAHQDLAP